MAGLIKRFLAMFQRRKNVYGGVMQFMEDGLIAEGDVIEYVKPDGRQIMEFLPEPFGPEEQENTSAPKMSTTVGEAQSRIASVIRQLDAERDQETEAEAIQAETLRRSKVRRLLKVRLAPTRASSPSPNTTPMTPEQEAQEEALGRKRLRDRYRATQATPPKV